MLVIENQPFFDEVVVFAKRTNQYDGDSNASLKNRLDYLAGYGGKKADGTDKTRARLYKDGAPYSFGFVIEGQNANGEWTTWFNGGLLYHGPHDGHGSGAAPTFAVSLDPNHLIELPAGAVFVGYGAALPKIRRMHSAWLRVWSTGHSLRGRVRRELQSTPRGCRDRRRRCASGKLRLTYCPRNPTNQRSRWSRRMRGARRRSGGGRL